MPKLGKQYLVIRNMTVVFSFLNSNYKEVIICTNLNTLHVINNIFINKTYLCIFIMCVDFFKIKFSECTCGYTF